MEQLIWKQILMKMMMIGLYEKILLAFFIVDEIYHHQFSTSYETTKK